MPIIEDDIVVPVPNVEPAVTTVQPVTSIHDNPPQRELYKSKLVNSKYVDDKSLLVHIEGQSWTVNYYSQMLASDEEGTSLAIGSGSITQQYHLIHNFEFKVTSPLSSEHNTELGTFSVTGEGLLYPGLKPNIGDMFLADIGDGRLGMLTVTDFTRMSILSEPCYSISYLVYGYLDDDAEADFASKVVKTSYYDVTAFKFNRDPLQSKSEVELVRELNGTYDSLVRRWYDAFYVPKFKTALLPVDGKNIYDPYITEFMLAILSRDKRMNLPRLALLDTKVTFTNPIRTLWYTLLSGDTGTWDTIEQVMRLVNSKDLTLYPTYGDIHFFGIRGLIYPDRVWFHY